MIFTVYSPYINDNEKASWNTTTNTLTLKLDENTTNQTDLLYGTTRPNGNNESEKINIELGHALAQITINVSATTNSIVTLKSLKINKTIQSGTCSVTYGNSTSVSWPELGSAVNEKSLLDDESVLSTTPITMTCLVVPCDLIAQTLTFTYTLSGADDVDLVYTTTAKIDENPNQLGASWAHGKNYIYNITIDPKQIEFNATEAAWDANTNGLTGDDSIDFTI